MFYAILRDKSRPYPPNYVKTPPAEPPLINTAAIEELVTTLFPKRKGQPAQHEIYKGSMLPIVARRFVEQRPYELGDEYNEDFAVYLRNTLLEWLSRDQKELWRIATAFAPDVGAIANELYNSLSFRDIAQILDPKLSEDDVHRLINEYRLRQQNRT